MTKVKSVDIYGNCNIANGVAIATVYTFVGGDRMQASGVSKKHPDDKFSPEVAENLAVGRALESLGKKLQKRANGLVKQRDDIAKHRQTVTVEVTQESLSAAATQLIDYNSMVYASGGVVKPAKKKIKKGK